MFKRLKGEEPGRSIQYLNFSPGVGISANLDLTDNPSFSF